MVYLSFLEELAKQKFGTTMDCRDSGFIVADGNMLNFATKHGRYPHSAVKIILDDEQIPITTDAVDEFQRRSNAVRVRTLPRTIFLEKSSQQMLTEAQLETIHACMCQMPSSNVILDNRIATPNGFLYKTIELQGSTDCDADYRELRRKLRFNEYIPEDIWNTLNLTKESD